MKAKCDLINKILQSENIIGSKAPRYSCCTVKITSKNFSDSREAAREFFASNNSGWFCDTSTSGLRTFSESSKIETDKIGWIIEGEAVSEDGKKSCRISQNQENGWTILTFEETDAADGLESITREVSIRKIGGGQMKYQIGYTLENGKLFPGWQRLLSL